MTAFGRVLSEMANHPNSVHLEENSLKAVFQTVLSTDCDASEILNIRVCYFEKKKKLLLSFCLCSLEEFFEAHL